MQFFLSLGVCCHLGQDPPKSGLKVVATARIGSSPAGCLPYSVPWSVHPMLPLPQRLPVGCRSLVRVPSPLMRKAGLPRSSTRTKEASPGAAKPLSQTSVQGLWGGGKWEGVLRPCVWLHWANGCLAQCQVWGPGWVLETSKKGPPAALDEFTPAGKVGADWRWSARTRFTEARRRDRLRKCRWEGLQPSGGPSGLFPDSQNSPQSLRTLGQKGRGIAPGWGLVLTGWPRVALTS